MNNLEKSEKFRGVLLFAFNTKEVNYVEIANLNAKLIKKNLQLPITLITEQGSTNISNDFDNIIFTDNNSNNKRFNIDKKVESWRNLGRYKAFELSPYLETIVIDVDYLQFDNNLLKLFDQSFDYRLMYNNKNLYKSDPQKMGPIGLPLIWATVFLFRRTKKTEIYFNFIERIEKNYNYYKNIFGIDVGNYRNDFAFSMANIILNGYTLTPEQSIPWPMITIENKIKQLTLYNQKFLRLQSKELETSDLIYLQNLHIMDKNYLLSDSCKELVEQIINET